MEKLVRVNNAKSKTIDLPKVDGYQSKTLLPGGNNVPVGHLSALRGTGKEWRHKQTGWYFTTPGWLSIVSTGEGEAEGPEAPHSLDAYTVEGAIQFATDELDAAVLRRWASNELREEVSSVLYARLGAIQELERKAAKGNPSR